MPSFAIARYCQPLPLLVLRLCELLRRVGSGVKYLVESVPSASSSSSSSRINQDGCGGRLLNDSMVKSGSNSNTESRHFVATIAVRHLLESSLSATSGRCACALHASVYGSI